MNPVHDSRTTSCPTVKADNVNGKKPRLELTWIGKENRPKLEPRILLEDAEKSYAQRLRVDDIVQNRLIHGDNLLSLKALESEFAGKVKCIYIDPLFNTQQALQNYDDGIEHSLWLSIMRDRLEGTSQPSTGERNSLHPH